jgi:hypothetical protein
MEAKPNLVCPLCGEPNQCGPARNGSLDTPCWCSTATIDPAALAAIPEAQRNQACICPACARGGVKQPG